MKTSIFTLFALACLPLVAQNSFRATGGGEYLLPEPTECISEEQRQFIFSEIEKSRNELEISGKIPIRETLKTSVNQVLFQWPVEKNPDAPYTSVWAISNFIDHNANYPNQLLDWNCGGRTYDTDNGYNHLGIDIFTWPFWWHQFQNNESWVVAAAEGIIIYKSDGNYDMNCSFNNSDWNAVYVLHNDGSIAWYGHMKSGSLTPKLVGETVSAGEYLGTIGSSGNSTGPHLHFEVYNSSNQLVDPYAGPCNNLPSGNNSWWIDQKPYFEPKINAVLTHHSPPVFNNCPQTEEVNLENEFELGQFVYGAIYLSDQTAGSEALVKLINPNNEIVFDINGVFGETYLASYWYWEFDSSFINQEGTWTLSLTYNNQTVNHNFMVGEMGTQDVNNSFFSIYPNPAENVINIASEKNMEIQEINIYNVEGRLVINHSADSSAIDISALPKGMYILKILSKKGTEVHKFLKK